VTAIGGCVDWTQKATIQSDCVSILGVQSAYFAGRPRVRTTQCASLGIGLFRSLPEDRFDNQPLGAGGVSLVADIRLDNRDELISLLRIDPALAKEMADSNILLQAWLRWAEDCLDRIVGDYAFAAFSTESRKLTLVRDPIGERPLFYATRTDGVAFSSTPRGLLTLEGLAAGLDLAALGAVAAGSRPAGSYLDGITKVQPGECITFSPVGQHSRSYWQPSLEPFELQKTDDYVQAFRDVLRISVASRLRRERGPICSDLSSGLDSSAVASTAGMIAGGDQVTAFTAAPREGFSTNPPRLRFPDESDLASLTAHKNGLKHRIVRPSGDGLSRMRAMLSANQDPYYNYVNLGWIGDIADATREEGGIIGLTGEYGNQTLHAGGIRVLGDLISQGAWRTWMREARLTSRNPHVRWRGILMNSFENLLPGPLTAALYRRSMGFGRREDSTFLRPQWIKKTAEREQTDPSDYYLERVYLLRTSDMGLLRKGHLSQLGVEQRAPLGDRRAIEFGLRLPREQLLSGGEFRPLARRALADRIPAEVLNATSRGYQGADWFEQFNVGEIRGMVEEIAGNSIVRDMIDVEKMHRALDAWPTSFEGFDVYQRLAIDLPMALGTGLFIVEAEKWLAGRLD